MAAWNPNSSLSPSTFFSVSPWQLMRRIQEDMDRVFGQLISGSDESGGAAAAGGQQASIQEWVPRVDISESDREWIVQVELPGAKQEDIDVRVQDHNLVIVAEMLQEEERPPDGQSQGDQAQGDGSQQPQVYYRERRYGRFVRVLPLPENVDENAIRCECENGILTIHVPKTEQASQQTKRIPVQAGQAQQQQGRQTERSPANGRTEQRQPAMAGSRGGEAGSGEAQGERKS